MDVFGVLRSSFIKDDSEPIQSDLRGHAVDSVAERLSLSPVEVLVRFLEGIGHDEIVVRGKSEVEGAQGQRAHPGEVHYRQVLVSEPGLEGLEDVPDEIEVLREDDHRIVPDVSDVRAGAVVVSVVGPEDPVAFPADTDLVLTVDPEGADVTLGCTAPVPDLEFHREGPHGPLVPVDPGEVSEHPALPLALIVVVFLGVVGTGGQESRDQHIEDLEVPIYLIGVLLRHA